MMKTFLPYEVIEQVEGLNSKKTLLRWTNLVKEKFGAEYFTTENIPFNQTGNRYPYTVYSLDDIKRFQSVAHILSSQPSNRKNLKEAIIMAFDSEVPIIKPKEAWEGSIEAVREELKRMNHEDIRLLKAIQAINRKLSEIEELLQIAKENKPRLFRMK